MIHLDFKTQNINKMNLSEQINADIKKAMLAREKDKLEALRAVKAAIMLEATKQGVVLKFLMKQY